MAEQLQPAKSNCICAEPSSHTDLPHWFIHYWAYAPALSLSPVIQKHIIFFYVSWFYLNKEKNLAESETDYLLSLFPPPFISN